MDLYKIRDVDFRHDDNRGRLIQLVHDGFQQVNVLESKKGSTRGAHFHKETIEAFFVISGSVKVEFIYADKKEIVIFSEGAFFEIPQFVCHNMYFPQDCLMVQMYSTPIENDDGIKDIYTEDKSNA